MPNFKPGNIVARVVLGESWRERNNTDFLHAEFGGYRSESYPRTASDDGDDDDAISIISTSSTATFDDAPGTGRTLDMYIFQPMGRRIERLAMRFTIASLHPARIAQYIGPDVSGLELSFNDGMTLHSATAELCFVFKRNGSTIVAGMKGLVKQTQSSSIDRSASALAALIRVSLGYIHKEIYANVSRMEPIFHLETLVRSHPDKKWFLLLVKLARETLVAIRSPSCQIIFDPILRKQTSQLRPSPETAQNLRQTLIRVLKDYRFTGLASLNNTIGEACAICAEAASTCMSIFSRGIAYLHILDTVYFTAIFILRSIYELADLASITHSKHIYMVLRTIACWLDAIAYRSIHSAEALSPRYDMDLLKVAIAFRSLVLVDIDTKYMLLPESFKLIVHVLLPDYVIPRRNREGRKDIRHIESLIEAAKQRTRRLLRSFDALEIEVRGCTSKSNYCTTQSKIIADPFRISLLDFGDEWWKCWKNTLERARRVRVQANSLTGEFREARRTGLYCWAAYELHRTSRHKWGQYLRSNMDWDWDLGTCMRRLFKVEPTREGRPPTAQCSPATYSEIDVDEEQGATWRLEAQGSLPKQVKIAYKTENGETQYMSFVPEFPGPGRLPVSESSGFGALVEESMDSKSNPMIVQDDSDTRIDLFAGEQETENASSSSLYDNEQSVDCENIPFGQLVDNFEGQQALHDVGFEGARVGEDDVISICSLD